MDCLEVIKRIKFADTVIASILSAICTVILYKILYPLCHYTNLTDFYIGKTIFSDHNKYLDVYIYLIYLILFFIFLFCIAILKKPEISQNDLMKNDTGSKQNNKIFNFIHKIQYLFCIGFIFLYPFDGNTYYKPIILISLLLLYSIFDIYKKNKNNEGFSPFALTAIIFAIFFNLYTGIIPIDESHTGERFATYFLHSTYNIKYYSDLMLVHGYMDVFQSWLGSFFINENTLYAYMIGETLFKNILFIIITIVSFIIFKNNKIFALPIIFLYYFGLPTTSPYAPAVHNISPDIITLYFIVYILLLNQKLFEKQHIWLSIYIIISYTFFMYWTTIGGFWFFSSIPVAIYQLIQIFKTKGNRNILLLPLIILCLMLIFYHEQFAQLLSEAKEYSKGTLFAFGDNFYGGKMTLRYISFWLYKGFVLFFTPIAILTLIKTLTSKKYDIEKIFFLTFISLFPIFSLIYTMGRTDNISLSRLHFVSIAYLLVVLPYFIYKYTNTRTIKIFKIIFIITFILALIPALWNFPNKISSIKQNIYTDISDIPNVGKAKFSSEAHYLATANLVNFVNSKGKDVNYLDMSNRGMTYLYLNKKIPSKYVSYYNSISSKQAKDTLKRIMVEPPDIVRLNDNYIPADNIYPSLRINSVYRNILLNNSYKLEIDSGNLFLVKTNEKISFKNNEIEILDSVLSTGILGYLPEVWANSIMSLPLEEVFTDYIINNIDETKHEIVFTNNINARNTDFIYVETEDYSKDEAFAISINNSNSVIQCNSKSKKILIPLDNFPSWLLNDKISEIRILTKNPVIIKSVKFYNKKQNIR